MSSARPSEVSGLQAHRRRAFCLVPPVGAFSCENSPETPGSSLQEETALRQQRQQPQERSERDCDVKAGEKEQFC